MNAKHALLPALVRVSVNVCRNEICYLSRVVERLEDFVSVCRLYSIELPNVDIIKQK